MLSSETVLALPSPSMPAAQSDADVTMELLALELSLDGFSGDPAAFTGHVRNAATAMGGALLFDLPASGLIDDCTRIAVLRVSREEAGSPTTVFACLERDGTTIRIEQPDERTAGLENFAAAFVDVLQRI